MTKLYKAPIVFFIKLDTITTILIYLSYKKIWSIFMKKVAYFSIFVSLILEAGFFPPTITSSIKQIDGSRVKLSRPFPKNGMSGIVMHRYRNGLSVITSIVVQTSSGNGKFERGLDLFRTH